MSLFRNPFIITAMLFLVLGVAALALNPFSAIMLLAIGLFAACAGVLKARRGAPMRVDGELRRADQGIQLH